MRERQLGTVLRQLERDGDVGVDVVDRPYECESALFGSNRERLSRCVVRRCAERVTSPESNTLLTLGSICTSSANHPLSLRRIREGTEDSLCCGQESPAVREREALRHAKRE